MITFKGKMSRIAVPALVLAIGAISVPFGLQQKAEQDKRHTLSKSQQTPQEKMALELQALEAKLRDAVAAGNMTQEQANAKLAAHRA